MLACYKLIKGYLYLLIELSHSFSLFTISRSEAKDRETTKSDELEG
ncbi:hypothetical protein SLEP1_g15138 [Rubroshorea leprosula]|uniref:Uncharacterized protein n=1 Tax=Rubroshorea leprosula TaxID=152421 RepID=A0AAV5IWV6_9ROSI|nr:hypothetical protein SLEP1_g15138 [Rubroshorea leprosula]